ncbi:MULTISPECIES: NAD(P)/FAD-dependent oxidoreductase [Bacillus]|uniref:FAD-dependent oxidoreductase n=1 Tax=Bacillus TaxID=1386 RepID=UPI000738C9BA|nr:MULTISPECIES: NAD(P)/FAD-dependent oxidoreductase [Bacillus]KUF22099.1 FAD-binding protein [Bacillus sp. G1(2015b)]MBR0602251.1 FAD-dependent monooxygenase [Bacillus safensis]
MSDLHVLIAGGGIGGLCLGQHLKKAGISFSIYEREDEVSKNGYRLHMNMDGGESLRAALPENLYELYVQTSRKNPRREMAVLIDEQMNEIGVRPHIGAPNDEKFPHTAVNRKTLCQILLSGIEKHVHFNSVVTGFEQNKQGVTLFLADGTVAKGDILVAADGINSAVRYQLMPHVQPIDTNARAIYSKSPLTKEIRQTLPDILFDGFIMAADSNDTLMAIGPFEPRRTVDEAAKELAPKSTIESVDDYVMITLGIPQYLSASDRESPLKLHQMMVDLTKDWHPILRGLVERIDPHTVAALSVRAIEPIDPWETSRVTLIGDAIHAMPPSFGAGANLALRDARILAEQIVTVHKQKADVYNAISQYEKAMRAYDYPIFEMSANQNEARKFNKTH